MLALLALAALAQPPAHVTSWRDQVDWQAAQAEAVDVLSGYLRVPSVNPPGNEDLAAAYLTELMRREGIDWEWLTHAPGRSSFVARVGPPGVEPLCLVSHLDVVSSDLDQWPAATGPLSGAVVDGEVWGRGALDMKGMGAIEALSLVWLKRLGVPLRREVVLVAFADEEVGNLGARDSVERYWDRLGCTHAINEGGLGIRDALFDGQSVHAISTAEKGLLWVRVIAEGRAGHGSTPYPGEAPDRLREAVRALERYRPRPVMDPAIKALLVAVGEHKGGAVGAVLKSGALRGLLVRPRLMAEPSLAAAMTNTLHLTGFGGAEEPNVVPSAVYAQLDCRLLPGTTPDEMVATLEHLLRKVDGVRLEVLDQATSNGSPIDDPLYDALAYYAVEDRPDAVAGPVLSVGFTDSLVLRPLGTRAYGYVPFEVDAELAETMHGHGERVPVDQVGEGLRRLFSIVLEVAAEPTP